jgi:hypothetical protein
MPIVVRRSIIECRGNQYEATVVRQVRLLLLGGSTSHLPAISLSFQLLAAFRENHCHLASFLLVHKRTKKDTYTEENAQQTIEVNPCQNNTISVGFWTNASGISIVPSRRRKQNEGKNKKRANDKPG